MDAAFHTHEVFNQPPPLIGHDLFATDRARVEAVTREGAAWSVERLADLGRTLGCAETFELGFQANRHPPVLQAFDRCGHRRDRALAGQPAEPQARRTRERISQSVQGALLVRFSPAAAADGFCASRLDGGSGRAFGTLPGGVDVGAVIARATPNVATA